MSVFNRLSVHDRRERIKKYTFSNENALLEAAPYKHNLNCAPLINPKGFYIYIIKPKSTHLGIFLCIRDQSGMFWYWKILSEIKCISSKVETVYF